MTAPTAKAGPRARAATRPARVSLNEVQLGVLKAARGCMLHEGLCEELSRAAVWLCRAGLDGLGAALEAMTAPDARAPASCERVADGWRFDPAAAAVAGPSALDLVLAEPGVRVLLARLDAPLVVLGQAGVAAGDHDRAFRLTGEAGSVDVCGQGFSASVRPERALAGARLGVESTPGFRPVAAVGSRVDGIEVDADVRARIDALAARTYVPASERSRALGAGAGLVDVD